MTRVHPTSARHHRQHRRPYVIAVNDESGADLGRLAVIERSLGREVPLFAVAYVVIDHDLGPGEICMDQTLRTALGLPPRIGPDGIEASEIQVVGLHMRIDHRVLDIVSGLVGRRYLLLRCAPPDPGDIEKAVCRVTHDDLVAMGSREAGRVVLFGAARTKGGYELRRRSLQALTLDTERCERRDRLASEPQAISSGWGARYRSASGLLGVEGTDLPYLFMDRDDREALGLEQLSPVLVRRDTRVAFTDELRDFGIAFLASLLALQPFVKGGGGVVGALLLAVLLVLARLRSQLR